MVCKGSLCLYSQLLNSKFVPFPERRLIDCLLFSLYGPSFQFVTNSIHSQLASLPISIVLRLDTYFPPHTTYPVLGCTLAWVDERWCHQEYFIGYVPISQLSEVSSSITKCLSSVGIKMRNCYVVTSSKSSYGSSGRSSFKSLPSVCLDDFHDKFMTILAYSFIDEVDISSHDVHPQHLPREVSLIESLRRANSLIEYLNRTLIFPIDKSSRFLQLECVDWDNLISIRTSLSRFRFSIFP